MNIAVLDKAEVLAALYNASHQLGMGVLDKSGKCDMTVAEARNHLKTRHYFDYLSGRVMKIDLSGQRLDPALYDRDNGSGAAERALAPLFAKVDPHTLIIRETV